jgi:hypothetical protein
MDVSANNEPRTTGVISKVRIIVVIAHQGVGGGVQRTDAINISMALDLNDLEPSATHGEQVVVRRAGVKIPPA